MPGFGKISVVGPANRDVYFKGIYDIYAVRLGDAGRSLTVITAPLGEHTLVTIEDLVSFAIDHEGVGTIRSDDEHIVIELLHVAPPADTPG